MSEEQTTSTSRAGLLDRFVPGIAALLEYRLADVPTDLVAGATVAVMLVPQAMAYAMLAGLPPIAGLYAALVPIVIYAVLGRSRQLAVGPMALISLILADGLTGMAAPRSAEYVELAAVAAGLTGLFLVGFGVARLGFLTDFVAGPVLVGFTGAAGVLIAASQVGPLFGIELSDTSTVQDLVASFVAAAGEIHVLTAVLGALSVVALVLIGRYAPKVPRALALVGVVATAVFVFDLQASGVAILGEIGGGLPPFAFPTASGQEIVALVPTALICALVGFMESYAIMGTIARRHGYKVRANQELVALGSANVGGALFGGYPICGALSRTAVNDRAGARGPLAGLFTGLILAAVLMFMSGALYFVPHLSLAAIIIVAAIGLVDIERARFLVEVSRTDFAVLVTTFVGTLALGIEAGLIVGVAASLIVFIGRAALPRIAALGRLPGTEVYADVRRHPEAEQVQGVLVLRIGGRIFFGNADRIVRQLVARVEEANAHALVLDGSGIHTLDSTSVHALEDLLERLDAFGCRVVLAQLSEAVTAVLRRAGLFEQLGGASVFHLVHDAVELNSSTTPRAQDDADAALAGEGRPDDQNGAAAAAG